MKKLNYNKISKQAIIVIFLTAGVFAMAVGVSLFLNPKGIVMGGFTGLAMLFSYLFEEFAGVKISIGIITLALNLPVFLFGFKVRGLKFGIYSLYSTVMFSVFVDIVRFDIAITESLLATLYGGLLVGLGLGIIIRLGGSTGGSDMLALLIKKKFMSISTGKLVLIIDAIVVALSAVVFGVENALYSFIVIFVSSKVIDFVVLGMATSTAYHIITAKPEELASEIFNELKRGVTAVGAKGMWTKNEQTLLICIVSRIQITALKSIIRRVDSNAFFYSVGLKEVIGEGFFDEEGVLKSVKPVPKFKDEQKNQQND